MSKSGVKRIGIGPKDQPKLVTSDRVIECDYRPIHWSILIFILFFIIQFFIIRAI